MAEPRPYSVDDALNDARRGVAGMSPEAQTAERSGDPHAADAIRRGQMANIDAEARQQAKDAQDAIRAQEQAQRDAEAARRAEDAQAVRAAAAAGVKTETDIETGRRTIATHPDGAPVYEAGKVGGPREEPRVTEIPAGFLGSPGETSVRSVWTQDYRDDRGNVVTEPVPRKVDAATGDTYVEVPDAFGRPQRQVTGKDPATVRKIEQARKLEDLEREKARLDVRDLTIQQARLPFEPRWKEVDAEFQDAQASLDALPKLTRQSDGSWMDDRGKFFTQAQVAQHFQTRDAAAARLASARRNYDPLKAKADEFEAAKQKVEEERLALKVREIRLAHNLPDDAPLDVIEQVAAGTTPEEDAPTPTQQRLLSMIDAEIGKLDAADAAQPTGQVLPAEFGSSIFRNVPQDLRVVPIEGGDRWGLGNVEDAAGNRIGMLSRTEGGTPYIQLDEGLPRDMRTMANIAPNPKLPIYLTWDRNQARKNPAESAKWVTDVLSAAVDPDAPEAERMAAVRRMGGDLRSIAQQVRDGAIPIRDGEALAQTLWGQSILLDSDPADPAAIAKWGEQNMVERNAMSNTGDPARRAQAWEKYLSDWTARNYGKPGFDLAYVESLYSRENPNAPQGITRAVEKAGAFAESVWNSAIVSTAAMAYGFAEHVTGAVASDLGADAEWIRRAGEEHDLAWRSSVLGAEGGRALRRNIANLTDMDRKGASAKLDTALSRAKRELATIASDPNHDPAAVDAVLKSLVGPAMEVYGIAPDEIADQWSEFRERQGVAGRTEDQFDATQDPALRSAVMAYLTTGNPAHWENFASLMKKDRAQRSLDTRSAALLDAAGDNETMKAWVGGQMAPPEEMGVEVVSNAVTFGVAKAAQTGLRVVSKTARGARVANALERGMEQIGKLGIIEDSLTNPARPLARAWNATLTAAKPIVPGAVGESIEEGVVAMGQPGLTGEQLFQSMKDGFLIGGAAGPLIGWSMVGAQKLVDTAIQRRADGQFAQWYNQTMRDVAGFSPIAPRDAETARAFLNSTALQNHDAAIASLVSARGRIIGDMRESFVAAPSGEKANRENAELAKLEAVADPKPAQVARMEVLRSRAATRSAGDRMGSLMDIEAQIGDALRAKGQAISAAIEAMEATRGSVPSVRNFRTGMAKMAAGNPETLTPAERREIAGAVTSDGTPYFEDSPTGPVLTTAGRGEIAVLMPEVARLAGIADNAVIPAPATVSQPAPTQTNEQVEEEAQTVAGPTPMGGPAETRRDQQPAPAPAAGQETPAASVPGIARPVFRITGDGDRRSIEGDGLERPAWTGPAAEAPAMLSQIQQQADSALAVANRAYRRALARFPRLEGKVFLQDESVAGSSGALATPQGILITLPDLTRELDGFPPAKRDARVDAMIDEEVVHFAQFAAVPQGQSPKAFYGQLWKAFSPNQQAAIRAIYGDPGKDWQMAAEGVRMLIQERRTGKFTELSKAFSKFAPPQLLELLAAAIDFLRGLNQSLPEEITQAIDAVQALLDDLSAVAVQNEGDSAPQTAQTGTDARQDAPAAAPVAPENVSPEPVTETPETATRPAEPAKETPKSSQVSAKNQAKAKSEPAPAGQKRRRAFFRAKPRIQQAFEEERIIAEILKQGGILSKTRAKELKGKEWWALNKSMYDDAPWFSNPTFNVIYTSKDTGQTPDELARSTAADGDLNEFWRLIGAAEESVTRVYAQQNEEDARMDRAEKQLIDFELTAYDPAEGDPVKAWQLRPGDELVIDGEPFKVLRIETDRFGDARTVLLEDGTRFGRQTVDGNQTIYVEEFEDSGEFAAENPPSPDVAEPAAERPRANAPASAMDRKNADSRELFADDGGFALASETTQDGDAIVAARKAKEEAQAAQEAAQGQMFADVPAMTDAEQAAADAMREAFDGLELFASGTNAFRAQPPADRLPQFQKAAQAMLAANIDTPQALAGFLDRLAPGGQLRPYSEFLWRTMGSFNFDLAPNVNWGEIYSPPAQSNDTPTRTGLDADRPDANTQDGRSEAGVPAGPRTDGRDDRPLVEVGTRSGDAAGSRPRPGADPAGVGGTGSSASIRGQQPADAVRPAGNEQPTGSGSPDESGVPDSLRRHGDPDLSLVPSGTAGTLAQGGGTGDGIAEVRKNAPALTDPQAEDVLFIERRLITSAKPGVLITNGTGTGKTFTGMGAIKRALDRGEKHVLIVVPNDKIGEDWVATAKKFFQTPDSVQLKDTKDTGGANRVVVTTYANLRQNMNILNRPWGMVVADEAHYLSQSKDGTHTGALNAVHAITWHATRGVQARTEILMADEIAEMSRIREKIDANRRIANRDDTMDQVVSAIRTENNDLEARLGQLGEMVRQKREELARQLPKEADRPKALLLSASPFAYHFSLDYAEGYLFNYPPQKERSGRDNAPNPREQFYIENFGYRMRFNKLTRPENAAATITLERIFADRLMAEGAIRGRQLEVDADYSRDFVLTPSALGEKIDLVMETIQNEPGLRILGEVLGVTKYLERRFLLEAMKAREAIERIKQHRELGRKVVVFHDYKKGGASNPLRLNGGSPEIRQAYEALAAKVPGFHQIVKELDNLLSPIDAFRRELPEAEIFNGDVPKKERRAIVARFNTSGSSSNILLVQRASGKEGISLHDTDGKHQRVLIDLGIPSRPTDAIQTEGRITRYGMRSNAVVEYLTTGTNFERWTFAETIAQRASTAENLAMGSRARALLQAFSSGYNDAATLTPSLAQGTGGKESDKARDFGDPFDNAVALYQTNQKKTSATKALEGADYFATPEPLGYMMIQWSGIRPGEKGLEPSGGHGAIARFMPDSANIHVVEPSSELAGRLALNVPDSTVHRMRFEEFNIVNKFDVVAMNPPFGTSGKLAMEHLEKGFAHLRQGGRLIAIIPDGPSMAKRFDAWYDKTGGVFLAGEILLPSVTFERAGTSVSTRIVVLDKVDAQDAAQPVKRDLRDIKDINELFERIRNTTIPARPVKQELTPAEEVATVVAGGRPDSVEIPRPALNDFSPASFIHTKTGKPVHVARINRRLDADEYSRAKTRAQAAGGYYSSYAKGGAIPGFHFADAESLSRFLENDTMLSASGTRRDTGTPDLFAALQDPQNVRSVGAVKSSDGKNALGAYRALTAKKARDGKLSAEEEQQLLNAETALGQKLAFDMDALASPPPPAETPAASVPSTAAPQRARQQQLMMGGEQEKGGQMRLFASATRGTGNQPFPEGFSLGIPRAEMPQVPGRTRSAMVQFLRARDIRFTRETVPADSLLPSQADFQPAKVRQRVDSDTTAERRLLVSQDSRVIDGHHQWLAAGVAGEPVDIFRFDAPAAQVLSALAAMPSVKTAQGKDSKMATFTVAPEVIDSYLAASGTRPESIPAERERVSQALAQIAAGRVAEDAPAYSQLDLFGGDPGQFSPGAQVARAVAAAGKRSKTRSPLPSVSDQLRAALRGDWKALAAEIQAKGRASQIIPELIERKIPSWNPAGSRIESPEDVRALMLPIRSPYFESLKVMVLDGQNNIVHGEILHVGSLNESVANISEIFGMLARLRETYGKNYQRIVISHNHPSGDPMPSSADEQFTRAIAKTADFLGFKVLDHVITNGGKYYSFTESGILSMTNSKEREYTPRKTNPRPADPGPQQTAPWEVIPANELKRMASPDLLAIPAAALRKGNPDSAFIFHLNTRFHLIAVEQFDGDPTPQAFAQRAVLGRANYGTYGIAIALPDKVSLPDFARQMKNDFPAYLGIRVMDVLQTTTPAGSPYTYQSARETGLMEESMEFLGSNGIPVSTDTLFASGSSPFYSQLSRVIDGKIQGRQATAEQVKAVIANPSNGVKAEEVKWSGVIQKIDALAAENGGKVPKAALLDWLATEGSVRFEEVTATDNPRVDGIEEEYRQLEDEAFRETDLTRQAEIRQRMADIVEEQRSIIPAATRFGQYVLPGGENYREVVLAMPVEYAPLDKKTKAMEIKEATRRQSLGHVTFDEGEAQIREIKRRKVPVVSYKSSHFPDVPNYVAHMRLNERVDAQGNEGLFIEELQSDRHQAGREKGYLPDNADLKNGFSIRPSGDVFQAVSPSGQVVFESSDQDEVYVHAASYPALAVADAPYRKDWPLALFKRALRDAVAGGKNWIGWTVGDTQNDRFDLSKQVDAIHLRKKNGLFTIYAKPVGREVESAEKMAEGVPPEKVQDYIGKDLAVRAGLDDFRDGETLTLEGTNLKVGGSGMKGFYDNILPKEIGKYVKQWGAKVERGSVGSVNAEGDYEIVLPNGKVVATAETKKLAEVRAQMFDGATVRETATPIWRIDITPEMAQSIREAGQALFASSSPGPQQITEQVLASIDPLWRDVFQATMAADNPNPAEIGKRFGLSEKQVMNITNQVRARIRVVSAAASPAGLQPAMQGQQIRGGRPDLALSTIPAVAAVDQVRNAEGIPDVRGRAIVGAEAEAMLTADYSGTFDALLAKARNLQPMTDTEVMAAKQIIARETLAGREQTPEERMRLALLIHGYRDIGTETARALAMRFDPAMKPAQRHAMIIAEALFTPDPATRARLRKAPRGQHSDILAGWLAKVDQIKASLRNQGIDLDATLAAFRAEEESLAEAAAESPTTSNAIEVTLAKASATTKAVVSAVRSGSSQETAAMLAGVSVEEAGRLYSKFKSDVRKSLADVARRIIEESLASSGGDFLDAILVELGLPDWDQVRKNDTTPPKRPGGTPRRRKSPRPAGQPDMSLDEYAARPLDTTRTGPQRRFRTTDGRPIPPGTFDIHNLLAMKRVIDAFSIARGTKLDKVLEYWRMSILSGPQTHAVNFTSNAMFAMWELLPRRAAEATINGMLGIVGQGADKAAAFGEFVPMARHLFKAASLAGRNALRSWQTEGRIFEAYASALPIELDFTGAKADYIPPALGGKLGRIMRNISFRPMTAADEMVKSFVGQLEAAAQAHRIARAEGLSGDAYASRFTELMEPGSIAWVRSLDEAQRITFQTPLDPENPRLIARLDQVAEALKRGRRGKYGGKLLTFFLPFIDTPTNIAKTAIEMSPLGAFISLVDGVRALKIRIRRGNLTPQEAELAASELYDRARLVRDLTNQILAWGAFWAIQGMVEPDEEDESGLPLITGSAPFRASKPGERDVMFRTMPPFSVRFGDQVYSYRRVEPFATALASVIDSTLILRQSKGLNADVLSRFTTSFKDQLQDKTFLSGLSDLLNAWEDPERFIPRLASNVSTGFIPNLVRQPIREADPVLRDTYPSADDGFFESVGKSLGYAIVPQAAPPRIDIWGNVVQRHGGPMAGGPVSNTAFRIVDPFDSNFATRSDAIDRYMLAWNLKVPPKERIGIVPIANELTMTVGGETKMVRLSSEEVMEANRNVGTAVRSMLPETWDWTQPTVEGIESIKAAFETARAQERARLRSIKSF